MTLVAVNGSTSNWSGSSKSAGTSLTATSSAANQPFDVDDLVVGAISADTAAAAQTITAINSTSGTFDPTSLKQFTVGSGLGAGNGADVIVFAIRVTAAIPGTATISITLGTSVTAKTVSLGAVRESDTAQRPALPDGTGQGGQAQAGTYTFPSVPSARAQICGVATEGTGVMGTSGATVQSMPTATTTGGSAATNVQGTGRIMNSGSSFGPSGIVDGAVAYMQFGSEPKPGAGSTSSDATLAGTGTISASGTVGKSTGASLAGAGTISAAGVVGVSAGASLAGTGTISAGGSAGAAAVNVNGAASLAGTDTITATGVVGSSASATLAGTDTIAATGVVGKSNGGSLAGTGSVAATGTVGSSSGASLAGTGTIAATGVVGKSSSASLAGTGTIAATGAVVSGTSSGASLAGVASISLTYVLGKTSPASLPGTGTIAATGVVGKSNTAARTGTGTITATGVVGSSASATLEGTGAISAEGVVGVVADAQLVGIGTIAASGSIPGSAAHLLKLGGADVTLRLGAAPVLRAYFGTTRVYGDAP